MSPEIPSTAAEILRRRVVRYFLVGVVVDAIVIGSFATHPEWLQYFYSERFPVITRLIFAVFFLGLGVTYVNFVRLVREEVQLVRAARNYFFRVAGRPDGDPTVVLEGVRRGFVTLRVADLAESGGGRIDASSDAAAGEVAAREEIHSGLAKYITAILTMLGLVGTFLGLIIAIQGISEVSDIEDKEAFLHGVKAALDGMGTAFSTSLAGIFGAVVLGFEQLMFHFAQVSFLSRLDRFADRYLAPLVAGEDAGTAPADVVPGAGELAAFTEAFRAWRGELSQVQEGLARGVDQLVESQTRLTDQVGELARTRGEDEDRLAELERKLDELRWFVGRENATLLGLVGTVAADLEPAPAADGDGEEGGGAGISPLTVPDDGSAVEAELASELRRTNQLLARIYGEMGMAIRSAAFKLEEGQTGINRSLAKLIQRLEGSSGSSVEQITMLRTILNHVSRDQERFAGLLDTLRRSHLSGGPDDDGGTGT